MKRTTVMLCAFVLSGCTDISGSVVETTDYHYLTTTRDDADPQKAEQLALNNAKLTCEGKKMAEEVGKPQTSNVQGHWETKLEFNCRNPG